MTCRHELQQVSGSPAHAHSMLHTFEQQQAGLVFSATQRLSAILLLLLGM